MPPRKLPHGEKQIHTSVSMPPEMWARLQFIAEARSPGTSTSAIVREAVAEYLARRFGPIAEQREAALA